MGRNSIVDDTNPIWWHLVEFVQIENECRNSTLHWNCTIWRFHQKKAEPDYHRLKTMVKRSIDQKLILRNFDARHRRIETGAVVKNCKGMSGMERGKRSLLSVESKKGSVREETNAVSGTTVMNVQNRHQKPLHPLSHQHQEVEVRRAKGASEARVRLGRAIDSSAKTSWMVLALNYFCD